MKYKYDPKLDYLTSEAPHFITLPELGWWKKFKQKIANFFSKN